jgi:hypothetical protein
MRARGTRPSAAQYVNEAVAIEALRGRGFTESFTVEGEQVRVSGSDRAYGPDEVRIREHYRFEGTSDPDDMSVVYALEATDGTCGILVDAFGSYADPVVGRLLDRVAMDRSDDVAQSRTGFGLSPKTLFTALAIGVGLALASRFLRRSSRPRTVSKAARRAARAARSAGLRRPGRLAA